LRETWSSQQRPERSEVSLATVSVWLGLGSSATALGSGKAAAAKIVLASSSLYCSSSSADFPAFLHNEREQLARTQPVQVGVVKP